MTWQLRRDYRLYDERRPDLGPYYVTWHAGDRATMGEGWERGSFDEAGVFVDEAGRYDPIDIFQYGLQRHADWIRTGEARARAAFLAQADWAAHAQTSCGGVSGAYAFPHARPRYACAAGFRSAAAQGEAISLLLRAYEETREDDYRRRAIAAAESCLHAIDDGGVAWRGRDGSLVFEDAAALPASHILRGWIYALWGLFELRAFAGNAAIARAYEQSLATLRAFLPYYCGRDWSYYNLLASPGGFRTYATLRGHGFHVAQLFVLASMTGDAYYSNVAARWQSFLESTVSRWPVFANALCGFAISLATGSDTVPGGARSIV